MPSQKAIIFDAFGTILKIRNRTHPFRRILEEGIKQGRRQQLDDSHTLMTIALGLEGAAEHFGIKIGTHTLKALEDDLAKEIEAVEAYADATVAVQALQEAGFKVAVCSNLAMPYAAAIQRIYPALDAYTYSFEVGAMKPEPEIYVDTCAKLGCLPSSVAMVGDSQRCDQLGPRELGIEGWFLNRAGAGDFKDLLEFCEYVLKQK